MPLRFDVRKMQSGLERKRARIRADIFLPELRRFAQRTFQLAEHLTPKRSLSLITANQRKQYHNRVSYIPSVHTLADPTLIVNDAGESWLWANSQWYAASYRKLPPEIESILMELEAERDRRLATPQGEFIAERAQARFLYKKVWLEVSLSAGVSMPVDAQIEQAHSRHNPAKTPPKGYAQWRGGKRVISLVVYTPLLDAPSKFKAFDGKSILAKATAANQGEFMREVREKMRRLLIST